MSHTLGVQLAVPNPDLVHRFRNLGEDIYRALCDISIGEIDAATSEFHLRGIQKRDVREAMSKVRKIADKNQMLEIVNVSEIASSHVA